MRHNFYLIFTPDGSLVDWRCPASSPIQKMAPADITKKLLLSLTEGDKSRWLDFCAAPPDFSTATGHAAIFRLFGFSGANYGFAEKNLIDGAARIYLYLFRSRDRFTELTSPIYLRFLPNARALTEENTLLSPMAALIHRHAKSLDLSEKNETDLFVLTQRALEQIAADPVFCGNEILFSDGEQGAAPSAGHPTEGMLVRFSTPAYLHLFYALLAVFTAATQTHEITVEVKKRERDAVLSLLTTVSDPGKLPGRKAMNGVTELSCLSVFAKRCEHMLAFADYVAIDNDLTPFLHFDPDTASLCAELTIAGVGSEGEFKYRDAYELISVILAEASGLYHLLTAERQE